MSSHALAAVHVCRAPVYTLLRLGVASLPFVAVVAAVGCSGCTPSGACLGVALHQVCSWYARHLCLPCAVTWQRGLHFSCCRFTLSHGCQRLIAHARGVQGYADHTSAFPPAATFAMGPVTFHLRYTAVHVDAHSDRPSVEN